MGSSECRLNARGRDQVCWLQSRFRRLRAMLSSQTGNLRARITDSRRAPRGPGPCILGESMYWYRASLGPMEESPSGIRARPMRCRASHWLCDMPKNNRRSAPPRSSRSLPGRQCFPHQHRRLDLPLARLYRIRDSEVLMALECGLSQHLVSC